MHLHSVFWQLVVRAGTGIVGVGRCRRHPWALFEVEVERSPIDSNSNIPPLGPRGYHPRFIGEMASDKLPR